MVDMPVRVVEEVVVLVTPVVTVLVTVLAAGPVTV